MKKKVSFLLIVLLLIPSQSFADYTIIEDSFEYVDQVDYTLEGTNIPLIYQITNQINPSDIRRAIRAVERNIRLPFDFNVHIMDFQVHHSMVLGIAHDDNNILIFDFLPFKSRILTHDVVTHEIGHLAYNRMTDWEKAVYKRLRGIPEGWTDSSEYEKRPTEIFAEDFRLTFGSKYATTFKHMNQDISSMDEDDFEVFVENLQFMN